MRSEELAANVPAITRDYISLAIQEALAPAIEEIFTEISNAKAMASRTPSPNTLAAEITQTVEASISAGIANIINSRTATFRQELDDSLSQIRQDVDACRSSADTALASIADMLRQAPAQAQDPTPIIEQAIAPLSQAIASINDRLSAIPSPNSISQSIAASVEASLAQSVASLVEQRSSLLRQDVESVLAQIQEETAKTEASADRLLTAVADLEVRVRKWLDRDRYSITRAHVLKAMRGKNNG